MDTVRLSSVTIVSGRAVGAAANPSRSASCGRRSNQQYSQTPTTATVPLVNQILDLAGTIHTLGVTATTNYDLTSGEVDPLGDSISSAAAFGKVKILYAEHDATSAATSGIQIFGAAASAFQGPLDATAAITILPGELVKLESPTANGWLVDATHKNFRVKNLDTTNTCAYRIFLAGTK